VNEKESMAETLNILVAEDMSSDVLILKKSFEKAGVSAPLHFVKNGQEVIDYFQGDREFADRTKHPLPALLLLDLKMPRMNGFEVLQWLRTHSLLRRLPVVVFSSSELAEDINRSYDLGANSYVVKRAGFKEVGELGQMLERYWFRINRAPEYEPPTPSGATATRVLLRSFDTGLFFKRPQEWTSKRELATDFKSIAEADRFAAEMALREVEALLERSSTSIMGIRLPYPGTAAGLGAESLETG
jgi:CheY-like chemotaxis protein